MRLALEHLHSTLGRDLCIPIHQWVVEEAVEAICAENMGCGGWLRWRVARLCAGAD